VEGLKRTYKLQYRHSLPCRVLLLPKEWTRTTEDPILRLCGLGSNSTDACDLPELSMCKQQSQEPNNRLEGSQQAHIENVQLINQDILCTTKTWILKPLKLQNVFISGLPILWPERFTADEDRKFIAIQKSLVASPLMRYQLVSKEELRMLQFTRSTDVENSARV